MLLVVEHDTLSPHKVSLWIWRQLLYESLIFHSWLRYQRQRDAREWLPLNAWRTVERAGDIGLSILFQSSGAMMCWFTRKIPNKEPRECIQHFLLKHALITFVLLNVPCSSHLINRLPEPLMENYIIYQPLQRQSTLLLLDLWTPFIFLGCFKIFILMQKCAISANCDKITRFFSFSCCWVVLVVSR